VGVIGVFTKAKIGGGGAAHGVEDIRAVILEDEVGKLGLLLLGFLGDV